MTRGASKIAAFGLLIAAVALFWSAVIVPLSAWRADTLAKSAAIEVDIERLQAAQARLETQKAALATIDDEQAFWVATQPGEAYAIVQGELARTASENGISFRAMTPLPATQRDGVDTATVRIEFEADLAQLTGFLRAIEYNTPALPVERAALRRLVRPNDTSRLPILFSQIDISAPLQLSGTE